MEYPAPDKRNAWLALRGAVLGVPVMLRVALRQPEDRAEAIRVARVTRQLYADAVAELGEYEGHELVGATLQYVRDRVADVFGQEAWEEASSDAQTSLLCYTVASPEGETELLAACEAIVTAQERIAVLRASSARAAANVTRSVGLRRQSVHLLYESIRLKSH